MQLQRTNVFQIQFKCGKVVMTVMTDINQKFQTCEENFLVEKKTIQNQINCMKIINLVVFFCFNFECRWI